MKKTSKKIFLFLLLVSIVFSYLLFTGATNTKDQARVIYKTKLFAEIPTVTEGKLISNTDPVIINQNEPIEIISATEEGYETIDTVENSDSPYYGNKYVFEKVKYYNYEGFILRSLIYYSANTTTNKISIQRALSHKLGEKIPVYQYYEANSNIIGYLVDGERVNVYTNNSAQYGNMSKIIFGDDIGYVQTNNLTTGLSLNQRVALIISGSTLGVIIVIIVILVIYRKKKRKEKA
ncbi:MAG: hypothetical protein K5765_01385 [Clostridia bacterium]|nr:hypothetical protein [Clostridia bacterium]